MNTPALGTSCNKVKIGIEHEHLYLGTHVLSWEIAIARDDSFSCQAR